jgi:hypothetical protein
LWGHGCRIGGVLEISGITKALKANACLVFLSTLLRIAERLAAEQLLLIPQDFSVTHKKGTTYEAFALSVVHPYYIPPRVFCQPVVRNSRGFPHEIGRKRAFLAPKSPFSVHFRAVNKKGPK